MKQFSTILDNSTNDILLNFIVKLVNQCFNVYQNQINVYQKRKDVA